MALFGFDPKVVPDIDFAIKDASIVQAEVITNYEYYFFLITRIQKTLARGDPVRLFLLAIIYQLIVQRCVIDSTGKENLVKYAHGANLDNIGARWGKRGLRLKESYAGTDLRFSLSLPLTIPVVIPLGTQVQSSERHVFATEKEGIIPPGETFIDLPARAVVAGESENGLVAGQVNLLVSWSSPFLVSASNINTTSGGADIEDDEHYRARIWMAPESFSVAGPYGAYEYWAASANANIMDVSVWSSPEEAGNVYIYPLMKNGELPGQEVLDQVYAVCNADDIRPLTDHVFVQAPTVRSFKVEATFWIWEDKAVFAEQIRQAVYKAFENYKIWQRSEIGRNINPSKMIEMLMDAGASRVGLISPGLDDPTNVLTAREVAIPSEESHLDYGGLERRDLERPPLEPYHE